MATVWIPPLLKALTGGQTKVTVSGGTVQDVINALDERYPGISARLCEDGRIRPGLSVVVDQVVIHHALRHPLSETSEVHFLPAISGG